jgi:large subunit ribosomal protein L24
MKYKLKRNDFVQVISGNHKGTQGRVKEVYAEAGRIVVANVNMRKKHVKPSQQNPQGGRVEVEGPIAISSVMAYCESCKKTARLRIKLDGDKKVRTCAKCGADYGEKY